MSTQATIMEGDEWFINKDLQTGEIFLIDDLNLIEIELTPEIIKAIKEL